MRITIMTVWLSLCSLAISAQGIENLGQFFEKANDFFSTYVSDGKVDYAAIKKNPAGLKALTDYMAKANLAYETKENKKAFYINAYNLTMIASIVQKYPIKSPLDDKDIFTGEKHTIGYEKLTLEQIEKDKLLGATGDERLHFVLVCAAEGCPQLGNGAIFPEMMDQQIHTRTKDALNSPYFIRVDDAKKTVLVSQIFNWYKDDFTKSGMSIIAYINMFRKELIPESYKLGYYEYDWSLNEKK